MRTLNSIFLIGLLAALAVFCAGTHFLHAFQVRRNATALLDRAERAAADNDLEKAELSLKQYLSLRRKDGPAWKRFAQIVDERDASHQRRDQIFLVYEEALRHNAGDSQLERRCVDLALELRRYSDAQRHLASLFEKAPKDSQSQPAAAEVAELEDLLGQCDFGLAEYDKAEKRFLKALRLDPERVSCYERLARMRRNQLRRLGDADVTIKEMVARNPKAARAYLTRWRYSREFLPSADANDLQLALGLAPDDPEVLFAAGVASEQKQDAAAARIYYRKGCKLHPKNGSFALNLARLEAREGHLDQAEVVLRQAYQASPSLNLAFVLAETLILQNKIDGPDQADDYIGHLRSAGLGETFVRFLDAEILFQRKKWFDAIPRLEMARAVLKSLPQLTLPLDLMLAECYGRVGSDEKRLDALRQAATGDRTSESARADFALATARSGKLDEAISTLSSIASNKPEVRLDLVGLLIRKAIRQPANQQNWQEVERYLNEAGEALPQSAESFTLLRADMLAARARWADARLLLTSAHTKDPRNLRYRFALARLAQREGNGVLALKILDQTEKDLGPSLEIQLARLDYWGQERGDEAKAAVAKLAETRQRVPDADQPLFLDRLSSVETRLGDLAMAREHLQELHGLQPANPQVLMGLFDMATQTNDRAGALEIVLKMRELEGERGTLWRFGQASCLLDQARRGETEDLKVPRSLAAEIAVLRPDWWGSSVLLAEIAEIEDKNEEAIKNYTRAIDLGNNQPAVARRLVGLLNNRGELGEIERLIRVLADRGLAPRELTIESALEAIRRQDYGRSIALARQVFPADSINFSDHLFLGQFYMAARRSHEAGLELRRAVELGPAVPITWVSYVQYLVQVKQIAQARATIESARTALPANNASLALAQCYALTGDARQAEKMIQAALHSSACDLTTIRVATDLFINLGRFDQVEPILDRLRVPAMKATPDVLAWASRARALALLSVGRLAEMDRALYLIEQNLKATPNNLDDLRLKAVILGLRTSRRGEAIKLLEPLDGSSQLGTDDQFLLARIYLAERLVEKYRGQMIKILAAGAKNPAHIVPFVDFLIGRQELDQADHWIAELKSVAPRAPILFELDTRMLKARNRHGELLELLQARARQNPDEIGVVAGLLDRYGFVKEAEAAYKSFVAAKPNEPERALGLASFLARQDRTDEAVTLLDHAWRTCRPEAVAGASLPLFIAPSADENLRHRVEGWVAAAINKSPVAAATLRTKLANIYRMQRRYDEAEALYRQILASDPDNVETLSNLAWELALREPNKAGEALDLVNRAIEKDGRTSVLVNTRAVALIRAGQLDQAALELCDARAADPEDSSLALHLAWTYEESGKTEEARKIFQQAEELGLKAETRDPLQRAVIDRLRQQLAAVRPTASNRS
jgi:cellulose synthase operon protein C